MADQQPTTTNDTLVWARYVGDPRDGGQDIDMWATDNPWWESLGTPVIDLVNQVTYFVVWKKDQQYRLSTLDLHSDNTKNGPIVIQGAIDGVQFFPSAKRFGAQFQNVRTAASGCPVPDR